MSNEYTFAGFLRCALQINPVGCSGKSQQGVQVMPQAINLIEMIK
ncbi:MULTISPECIES: hypothetical protein [unclassified Pseudomonas]|nr:MULTISPECIES: hypothetical protein [unclassified Pseudomonas]